MVWTNMIPAANFQPQISFVIFFKSLNDGDTGDNQINFFKADTHLGDNGLECLDLDFKQTDR